MLNLYAPDGLAVPLRPASVLVVDADRDVQQQVGSALREQGVTFAAVGTGAECLEALPAMQVQLLLVDLLLPDMPGTELIRLLHQRGFEVPFVMFLGVPTIRATVEAMRLGAVDVVEKPIAIDELVSLVQSAIGPQEASPDDGWTLTPAGVAIPLARPRTPAERWAMLVVRACAAERDPATLDDWARCAGVTDASLCESCRLVSIRPHDARDLARALRAVVLARRRNCPPAAVLDGSQGLGLADLLERAGLLRDGGEAADNLERFVDRQRFVSGDNEGLQALKRHLAAARPGDN